MYHIRVTREFAASHAIYLPDGSLEPLHGHNWPVSVVVASAKLDGIETVMDFHVLDRIVAEVIEPFQSRHLNDVAPFTGAGGRLAVNPTAERVAEVIGQAVAARLPAAVTLVSVEVGEAPRCWASYLP